MMDHIKRGTRSTLLRPQQRMLSDELGKYVAQDAKLATRLGWEAFVKERQRGGDLTNSEKFHHLDRRVLQQQ